MNLVETLDSLHKFYEKKFIVSFCLSRIKKITLENDIQLKFCKYADLEFWAQHRAQSWAPSTLIKRTWKNRKSNVWWDFDLKQFCQSWPGLPFEDILPIVKLGSCLSFCGLSFPFSLALRVCSILSHVKNDRKPALAQTQISLDFHQCSK